MHAAAIGHRSALIALALTAGCSSMQRVPSDYINEGKPAVVHLSNRYGIVTTVHHPTLSGDTVYGAATSGNQAVAVPLGQVDRISTVKFSTGRTVALVTAATGVVALVAFTIAGGGTDTGWYCDWSDWALERNGGMPLCGPR